MKRYCYLDRGNGNFKMSEMDLEDYPIVGIGIGWVDGADEIEIEQKAKEIMRRRFAGLPDTPKG